jgi:hypothetical protein
MHGLFSCISKLAAARRVPPDRMMYDFDSVVLYATVIVAGVVGWILSAISRAGAGSAAGR